MKKIITCIGIRPDIIRLSQIIKKLDKSFKNIIVDSGQHYDYNLNKIFYDQLGVRLPDYNLNIKSGTHASQVAKLMIEFEKTLLNEKPDFVVVLGDNNSSLGFTLATSKLNKRYLLVPDTLSPPFFSCYVMVVKAWFCPKEPFPLGEDFFLLDLFLSKAEGPLANRIVEF